MGFFNGLLNPRIAVVETAVSGDLSALLESELPSVERAVSQRRREFTAGRHCARAALELLGHAPVSLPSRPDRVPLWPDGIAGSITHTRTWAAAAVGRREIGLSAVGIDLEPAEELPEDLWSSISTPQERALWVELWNVTPGLAARLLFCMKEAAFKCQYTLTKTMLEFGDLTVTAGMGEGTFLATFCKTVPPFQRTDQLVGRIALRCGNVSSAVVA